MDYYEKTIKSERLFKGAIFDMDQLTVELPNGKKVTRDVIRNPGASVIVPLTEDGQVIMVRQFRKPIESVLLEVPAGKMDPGEDPLQCAARELKEETGYTAKKLMKILTLHPAPGFADEVLHVFVACGLSKGESCPDEDEFIHAEVYEMDAVIKMIEDGAITDAKTICGVLFTARLLENGKLDLK